MSRGRTTDEAPEVKLQITPMIDVTFLLLVFFMLLPFRSLERQLSAHLPTDRGVITDREDIDPEAKSDVALRHDPTTGITTNTVGC